MSRDDVQAEILGVQRGQVRAGQVPQEGEGAPARGDEQGLRGQEGRGGKRVPKGDGEGRQLRGLSEAR